MISAREELYNHLSELVTPEEANKMIDEFAEEIVDEIKESILEKIEKVFKNHNEVIIETNNKLEQSLKEIKEETKRQKDTRAEYISLIWGILDNNTFSEKTICGKTSSNVWRLNFATNTGRTEIYFSSNIIIRNDKLRQEGKENGLTDDEEKSIASKIDKTNDAINYLINVGRIDDFIEYLLKKAIPLYLQDQYIPRYRI